MDVISCTQVSKSYANQHALNQLTFSIKEDTITGLIGRNGAGKTTLLKTLAGYIHATMGMSKYFLKIHLIAYSFQQIWFMLMIK
ncbi:ATP-binding cassette domain-containing protein [Paracerasibacillus soli]|uniref:ATP-binding cassette domain-containing protein n=1 Tax=Paracerasibacillus soli TaxID=480284 RepID=A0ABU5CWS7_9BACI|nr:ATP-binding cassette domain-containing protein [Virgibacillus soli]MDY0410294.1 ATP-binding cassette domain-containing protein [Virgibacillus soli]